MMLRQAPSESGRRDADRSLLETVAAVDRLGRFTAELSWETLPGQVRERALLMLADTLGVAVAGARTPELRRLLDAWAPPAGDATVLGTGRRAGADDAAWLNGTAACALELDEGNKHAQGHPAAHVLFAAVATAQTLDSVRSGGEVLAALVAGYEVAARFGQAVRRRTDLHTHGHWGATGAGAAVAALRRLPPGRVAAAIDAAGGLVYVSPWAVVLDGSFVRNLWAAGANVSGLVAARLAAAGLAEVAGTPARTLGGPVGDLDPAVLTEGLGDRFAVTEGYVKRHASCSYTHPAADAVLALRARHGFVAADVARVTVDTHRLAAPLAPLATRTRLAAMFSIPYVVAVALADGAVAPASFDEARRGDPATLDLAARVSVRHDPALDRRLPAERVSRVTVDLGDGVSHTVEQPNPVGDADHEPFGPLEVRDKLSRLIGADDARRVLDVVAALPEAPDGAALLGELP